MSPTAYVLFLCVSTSAILKCKQVKPGKEKHKKKTTNWTQRDSGGNNHFTFADEKIFTWLYVLQREGGRQQIQPAFAFFSSVVLYGTFTYNNQHRFNLEEQKNICPVVINVREMRI